MKLISFVALFLFSLVYKVTSECLHDETDTTGEGGDTALSDLQYFVGERMFAWRAAYATPAAVMSPTPSRDLAQAANGAVLRVTATQTITECATSPQYEWYATNFAATPTACCQLTALDDCAFTYLGLHIAEDAGVPPATLEMSAVNYIISAGSATAIDAGTVEAAVDAMVGDPQFDVVVVGTDHAEWGAFVGPADAAPAGSGLNYISFAVGTPVGTPLRLCSTIAPGTEISSSVAPAASTTPDPDAITTTDPNASSDPSDTTTVPPGGGPITTTMSSSTSSAMAVFTSSMYLLPTICYLTLFITQ